MFFSEIDDRNSSSDSVGNGSCILNPITSTNSCLILALLVKICFVSVYGRGKNRRNGSVSSSLDLSGKTVNVNEGAWLALIKGKTALVTFGVSNTDPP
jgi:hypothetical protein